MPPKAGRVPLLAVITIVAMSWAVWIMLLVAPLSAVIVLALIGRHIGRVDRSDATLRAARRAIRQSVRDRRRRTRGSIRGAGYGGDDNQAYNAGVASDGGSP